LEVHPSLQSWLEQQGGVEQGDGTSATTATGETAGSTLGDNASNSNMGAKPPKKRRNKKKKKKPTAPEFASTKDEEPSNPTDTDRGNNSSSAMTVNPSEEAASGHCGVNTQGEQLQLHQPETPSVPEDERAQEEGVEPPELADSAIDGGTTPRLPFVQMVRVFPEGSSLPPRPKRRSYRRTLEEANVQLRGENDELKSRNEQLWQYCAEAAQRNRELEQLVDSMTSSGQGGESNFRGSDSQYAPTGGWGGVVTIPPAGFEG
jgi:hypothetical protein